MPRDYTLRLSKYSITKNKYRELKYFCLQYEEKKRQLEECYSITSSQKGRGDSIRCSYISKPTESAAIRAEELEKDIKLIEQTAIETDSEIYQYILRNVTQGISYEKLRAPCGINQFYKKRRKYFYLLSIKK